MRTVPSGLFRPTTHLQGEVGKRKEITFGRRLDVLLEHS
jgi:hypothetical protein